MKKHNFSSFMSVWYNFRNINLTLRAKMFIIIMYDYFRRWCILLILGICGGSGSGKSALSQIAVKHGMRHLDTDAIYHTLTKTKSPCLLELCEKFGNGILSQDGGLDRRKLSDIVFGNSEKRIILNKITHKHILSKVRELIEEARKDGYSAVLVDAPLLFESEFDKECDYTIAVAADVETRIGRITKRDGIDTAAAKKRIDAQIPDTKLRELADFTILNNGTISELENCFLDIISIINTKKG